MDNRGIRTEEEAQAETCKGRAKGRYIECEVSRAKSMEGMVKKNEENITVNM